MGGRSFVFRTGPPRLEPLAPPAAAPGAGARGGTDPATKPAPDLSDPGIYSMPPVAGVRDVNEVY